MFVYEEMDAFEELVAGNHPIPTLGADQGGIMADPKSQRATSR
jgi:hypothetical protein